jgi:hypothetical protein
VKAIIAVLFMLFSVSSFAQKVQTLDVDKNLIKLDDVHETNFDGTKRFFLKLSAASPESFKVKFKYHYHFTSKTLDSIVLSPGGISSYNTTSSTEYFEGHETMRFNIAESSVLEGEELQLLVEVSKPHKNTHGIKVVVKLVDEKGNTVNGGRKLLGLLGHSYEVKKNCHLPL